VNGRDGLPCHHNINLLINCRPGLSYLVDVQVLFKGSPTEAFINLLLRIVELPLLVSAGSSLVPSSAKQQRCLPYCKNI
jgi:hypothetical protein